MNLQKEGCSVSQESMSLYFFKQFLLSLKAASAAFRVCNVVFRENVHGIRAIGLVFTN
jgi:hypothetical protein